MKNYQISATLENKNINIHLKQDQIGIAKSYIKHQKFEDCSMCVLDSLSGDEAKEFIEILSAYTKIKGRAIVKAMDIIFGEDCSKEYYRIKWLISERNEK